MATVYTYDVTTDIGKVRLKIGDTTRDADTNPPQFTDAELQAFLDEASANSAGNNVLAASGLALLSWAAIYQRKANSTNVGAWSENLGDVAGNMIKQAQLFFEMGDFVPSTADQPAFGYASIDWDESALRQREFNEDVV